MISLQSLHHRSTLILNEKAARAQLKRKILKVRVKSNNFRHREDSSTTL
jgi:hypothetical protein